MFTCPYCGTELIIDKESNHAECRYCEIMLGPTSKYGMYAQNGERKQRIREKNIVSSTTAQLPLPELEQLHVVDLVLCLQAARAERAQVYNLMRLFNKAEEIDTMDSQQVQEYKGLANETGGDYEYWTRRCWMIENLLLDRIGYFPERINQLFLDSLITKNEKSLIKKMVISKQKRENNRVLR
jgi:hypothetical protein